MTFAIRIDSARGLDHWEDNRERITLMYGRPQTGFFFFCGVTGEMSIPSQQAAVKPGESSHVQPVIHKDEARSATTSF